MDELSLIVEGIINKINKLSIRNQKYQEKITELLKEQSELGRQLEEQKIQNKQLQQKLVEVQVAKFLDSTGSYQAKQKVNELLREVEKCYALLNR